MAINKKLIHFRTKTAFTTELNAGNILDTSIVFIKDTKEIWTHGQLYSCSLTEEEVISIIENSDSISNLTNALNNKVDKVPGKSLVDDTEIIKLSELPSNSDLNNRLDTKLDASAYVVDTELSATSPHPVQNKIVNSAITACIKKTDMTTITNEEIDELLNK